MGTPWVGPWDSQIFTAIKNVTGTSRNGLKSVTINKQGRRNGFSKVAPWRGSVGAPWVGPWDSQIFTTIKKVTGTSRNGLKSVTISKQGRRNGFLKGSPLDGGPGAPWGLHGWAPGIHNFLPHSKTLLAPLENGLKSVTINKQGRRNGFSKVAPQEGLHGGSMGGGPLGFTIFYHNQKHYWHLLKSVTINEQGRRNGFSKVAPWFEKLEKQPTVHSPLCTPFLIKVFKNNLQNCL
jgi:hypothetical protein